jgi:hypothetical protein
VHARLYVGPQDQDVLAKLAPGLDLVVDYGIFTIIAAPLFWLLKWLHGLIGNWGWAIIVMTIMIKGAFFPLNAASARSMGKMKIVAPKMKALQAQYANDKAAAAEDDGALQAGEDQPARRLPADHGADTGVHRSTGCCCRRSSCVTRRGSAGFMIFRRPTRGSSCRSSMRSPRIFR